MIFNYIANFFFGNLKDKPVTRGDIAEGGIVSRPAASPFSWS